MENPKIRFKGFTKDWEQRKLGDVFEQTSNLVNPKEDEIELWSLTVEDGLTKKSDRYNREFLVKKDDNFKEVRPGDIVYNPMNMTLGAVGYNGMAKSVAVSGYYTTMVAKENYDTYYINTWLKSPQAIRLYRTYATGSLIEKQRVQFPTLSIIPVTFPKYEEQIKIGSYFHSIDNLITLHQRKCEQTKKLKKYMLQKMFPQNGAKVPEIRFDGFTYDWEQRKLGELGTVQTCKRIFKDQTSEKGDIPFFKNGTIGLKPDSYISREMYEEFRRLYPYPEVGDTLISVVGSIGRTAEYTGKDEYFQDSNVVWLKTDGSINKKFLKISYQVIKWLIEGSTVKHLYNDNILRSEIVMPVSQIEQAKIAEFFEELDHLITLHQRKCDELKKMKKYMLQNMFI